MNEEQMMARIIVNPQIMGGKPIIAGTRLTVQYILKALADGVTVKELIEEYDGLSREDISACLLYAAKTVENVSFQPSLGEIT